MSKTSIHKTKWPKSAIKEVCLINPSKKELNGLDAALQVSFGMMDELPERKPLFVPSDSKTYSEVQKSGYSYFKEGDVLLAKMTPCFENGKSGIATNLLNGIGFGSTEFYVLRTNGKVIPYWIYSIISSDSFLNMGKYNLVGTTGRRRLMKQFVENFEIPLPPIEEQKRIAAFFQSIDTTIEQCEQQEGKLKRLRSKLANDLVKPEPEFGNLLTSENCKPVTLADLANEMRESTKNPLEDGIERFVGLEHIEPGNLDIQGWGNVADGTTFTKTFAVGDVLFGKRRSYLKKAAIADFNGLCSGDILVLRPNAEVILPELFPYLISADAVFDFAVSNSAGSLSPRTKWRDLSKYELSIPDLKTQKKVLGVFESLQTNMRNINQQHQTLNYLKQKLLDDILN